MKDRHRGAWLVPRAALRELIIYAEKVQLRQVNLVEVDR